MDEKTNATKVIDLEAIAKDSFEASVQEKGKKLEGSDKNSKEDVSLSKSGDSKEGSGDLANEHKVPSNEELKKSLHESLESTPHSIAIREDPESNEDKCSRPKVWIPVLCLVAIFLVVVVVVVATQSNKSKTPKIGKQ